MRVHGSQLLCWHHTCFPCRRSRAKPEQSCCSFQAIPRILGSESRISSLKRGRPQRSMRIGMLPSEFPVFQPVPKQEWKLPKKSKKKIVRREYSKADVRELRAHSKARTPVDKIATLTKRTVGSLRQKALKLGIRLGHQR